MTIVYPTSLPYPLQGEFSETVLETKVKDNGEVGAARLRNRFTRLLRRWNYKLTLTAAQKDALLTFYDTTLERGVESFTWTHPTTTTTYTVIMTERPTIDHYVVDLWSASIDLEEI